MFRRQLNKALMLAVAATTLAFGALVNSEGANAATYNSTSTCSAVNDVSPDANLCFGTTVENANAQQVNLNSDIFVTGASSVTGLFGYKDWTTFQSVGSVPGDQKSGSIIIDGNTFGMVAVLLKSSNTFAAYLFENGLQGTLNFDTANNKGLSNYVVAGRDASPIPVPAAGILLITALGGLGVAARRRRKSS